MSDTSGVLAMAAHAGSWAGSNEFRLMPSDPAFDAAATADIGSLVGGNLTAIAYTWTHPQHGIQSGHLVLGADDDPPGALAIWSDSWHQSPAAKALVGDAGAGVVTLGYDYAGDWHWRIVVDATRPDRVVLRMDNVVPESAAPDAAGPYTAMLARFRRSP